MLEILTFMGEKWHFVTQVKHVSRHFEVYSRKQNKLSRENFLKHLVSDLTKRIAYVYTKLLLEKSTKKWKKKNENIYNLRRIWGTKPVLLVDFWDRIFKKASLNNFFSFYPRLQMASNMCKLPHKVHNGQNLPHKSPNFTNYFFQSIFTYNLGHISTSLRPHYHNSFFSIIVFVFYSQLQDVKEHMYLASQIV